MRKIITLCALALTISLCGCKNYMAESDPILAEWVSDDTNDQGLRFVLHFVSEVYGEEWYEKDKKLNGQKAPFIYTRSQTELHISPNPLSGEKIVKISYKINSLAGSTLSLTNIETQKTTTFTKK